MKKIKIIIVPNHIGGKKKSSKNGHILHIGNNIVKDLMISFLNSQGLQVNLNKKIFVNLFMACNFKFFLTL